MTRAARRLSVGVLVFALSSLAPMCIGYKADVEKVCDAERLSGGSMKADGTAVMDWLKRNVSTSEALVLVNELSTKDSHGKAIQLRGEIEKVHVASCALADTCDALGKDEDYRGDIANLCSGRAIKDDGSVARLDIGDADDAERYRELVEWTRLNAKSADTQTLVAKASQAAPKDRSAILRNEANRLGITPCGLADALDKPPPGPIKPPPLLAAPTFAIAKIDTAKQYDTVIENAINDADTSAAINTCYAGGLSKVPSVAGQVVVKLIIDGKGRVTKATDDGSKFPEPGTVKCIVGVLLVNPLGKAPPDTKAGTKATVTLVLTPAAPDQNNPLTQPINPNALPDAGAPRRRDGGAPRH